MTKYVKHDVYQCVFDTLMFEKKNNCSNMSTLILDNQFKPKKNKFGSDFSETNKVTTLDRHNLPSGGSNTINHCFIHCTNLYNDIEGKFIPLCVVRNGFSNLASLTFANFRFFWKERKKIRECFMIQRRRHIERNKIRMNSQIVRGSLSM